MQVRAGWNGKDPFADRDQPLVDGPAPRPDGRLAPTILPKAPAWLAAAAISGADAGGAAAATLPHGEEGLTADCLRRPATAGAAAAEGRVRAASQCGPGPRT